MREVSGAERGKRESYTSETHLFLASRLQSLPEKQIIIFIHLTLFWMGGQKRPTLR